MNETQAAYIAGMGMITPIGANVEMTAAAVKAGISAATETDRLNSKFDSIKMAMVPDDALPPLDKKLASVLDITARQSRMLRLAHNAIVEAMGGLKQPLPLFLAGPEPAAPGLPLPMRSSFIKYLNQQAEVNLDEKESKVYPMGRAAGFYAIYDAFEYLQNTDNEYVLVGGVDSYWDALTLGFLARDERVQTVPGAMNAFVPGEGASFLLLTLTSVGNDAGCIYKPGLSTEEGGRYSEKPYLGNGLSQCFKIAIDNGDDSLIKNIYSSLNGEAFGTKEHYVASTRSSNSFEPDHEHLHPAEFFGDLGAASGITLIGLAAMNRKGYSICYGASDHEFRGAACVA